MGPTLNEIKAKQFLKHKVGFILDSTRSLLGLLIVMLGTVDCTMEKTFNDYSSVFIHFYNDSLSHTTHSKTFWHLAIIINPIMLEVYTCEITTIRRRVEMIIGLPSILCVIILWEKKP